MKWISESNRPQHLIAGVIVGVLFGIIVTAVMAAAVELKDKMHGGAFDYLDILATMIGGVIGILAHALIHHTWLYILL